jgi:hypothetical protein
MILKSRRAIVSALFLATLLIGLAHVALLPPWEGFDETAHFSFIEQIADTGTWPQGKEPLSQDVEASSRKTPAGTFLRAWGSYDAFKTASPETLHAAQRELHDTPTAPRVWRPGEALNWQNQHPPLYYAVLVPVHWATKNWSLASELLAMRAVSYLIAWSGLLLAAVAALRTMQPSPTALALALWPLMFPMWFPEMGRVGNDSLLVPIVAAAWIIAQPLLRHEGSAARYTALGLVFGLGLLTKSTFLPFAGTITLFVALPLVRTFLTGAPFWPLARKLSMLAIMGVMAGWWYLLKLVRTGSLIGSYNEVALKAQGGLLAGIRKNASLYSLAKIPWIIEITFLWGGTWSFILPPLAAILPLVAMTFLVVIGYWVFARARHLTLADHVPLITACALLAALLYQGLVLMSAFGPVGIGGWYLHSFAAILGSVVGIGMAGALSNRLLRLPLLGLLFYPLFFLILAAAVQAMVFAGCGHISPTGGYYPIASIAECATQWPTVHRNLAVLGFPKTALVLFSAGWIVALIGLIAAVRTLRAEIAEQPQRAARGHTRHSDV